MIAFFWIKETLECRSLFIWVTNFFVSKYFILCKISIIQTLFSIIDKLLILYWLKINKQISWWSEEELIFFQNYCFYDVFIQQHWCDFKRKQNYLLKFLNNEH